MPHDAHPMGVLVSAMSTLSVFHPDANPALRVSKYVHETHTSYYFSLFSVLSFLSFCMTNVKTKLTYLHHPKCNSLAVRIYALRYVILFLCLYSFVSFCFERDFPLR